VQSIDEFTLRATTEQRGPGGRLSHEEIWAKGSAGRPPSLGWTGHPTPSHEEAGARARALDLSPHFCPVRDRTMTSRPARQPPSITPRLRLDTIPAARSGLHPRTSGRSILKTARPRCPASPARGTAGPLAAQASWVAQLEATGEEVSSGAFWRSKGRRRRRSFRSLMVSVRKTASLRLHCHSATAS